MCMCIHVTDSELRDFSKKTKDDKENDMPEYTNWISGDNLDHRGDDGIIRPIWSADTGVSVCVCECGRDGAEQKTRFWAERVKRGEIGMGRERKKEGKGGGDEEGKR